MNKMAVDDSSDEDDPYTNFAGRLKALKQKRFKKEEPSAEIDIFSIDIEEQKNGEQSSKEDKINKKETNDKEIYDDDRQIQRRMVRSRRNKGITTHAVRQTRGRQYVQPVDDLECDIEIVLTEEKPESIPNTCNNDVISLSDDEVSIKDDNYEINIKVLWRSKRIDRLNIHRNDNFEKIFQYYADLEKVSVNEILIMKKDKIINRTDTPASLKLSIIDILDGGIVHPGMNALSEDKKNDDDEDTCTIKVQTANKKQSLTIPLKRDQQFKALFINCAEQLGIKESSLKFYFDGEQISLTDTPNSLDLEGEACIDLHIAT
ncbi:DNA repair protein Rad60 isoform X1 [Anoplolepis gracilipes]|uniref:DNA repair protein Rad60 isoform X1 n=1 Tax=Anoplolepis gracilipes TaxID=354296 RepID=UPI003BA1A51F